MHVFGLIHHNLIDRTINQRHTKKLIIYLQIRTRTLIEEDLVDEVITDVEVMVLVIVKVIMALNLIRKTLPIE